MIVVDASVLANAVADDGPQGALAREVLRAHRDLAAPDLIDVETNAVFRRRWLARELSSHRFEQAAEDLRLFPIARYPTRGLMRRAFELRENVTAYDACYVALAEALQCSLATGDRRLAKAPGPRCPVQFIAGSLPESVQ